MLYDTQVQSITRKTNAELYIQVYIVHTALTSIAHVIRHTSAKHDTQLHMLHNTQAHGITHRGVEHLTRTNGWD